MDFDSHISSVVSATVALVNALTPGWAGGREWDPAEGERLAATRQALALATRPGEEGPTAESLDQFADYAASLRTVFEYVGSGELDAACQQTNTLLRETAAAPVLARHDGEPWHLHFHAIDASYARGWGAGMATSLAVVLGGPFADRLGVCSAPACDRVYVDTSRNGTRRFCSTSCQNRVKAAAFRERKSAT